MPASYWCEGERCIQGQGIVTLEREAVVMVVAMSGRGRVAGGLLTSSCSGRCDVGSRAGRGRVTGGSLIRYVWEHNSLSAIIVVFWPKFLHVRVSTCALYPIVHERTIHKPE